MKNHTYFTPSSKSASVRCLTFFLFCVCWIVVANHTMLAQSFGREWIRYRWPADPRPAKIKKIVTDASGNAYAIGEITHETLGLNYVTIKYSPSGEKLWQQEYSNVESAKNP